MRRMSCTCDASSGSHTPPGYVTSETAVLLSVCVCVRDFVRVCPWVCVPVCAGNYPLRAFTELADLCKVGTSAYLYTIVKQLCTYIYDNVQTSIMVLIP